MGQEIESYRFTQRDFDSFSQRLKAETELLALWLSEKRLTEKDFAVGSFDDSPPVAGFELEAWLVDKDLRPAPVNDVFLKRMGDDMMSPELARFNVEFNVDPVPLRDKALSKLASELGAIWKAGQKTAADLGAELAMIGILPTVADADLVMNNLSAMNRYVALNAEILRQRGGRPLKLDIHGFEKNGHDILRTEHQDVMLESATTSFQIHLQIPPAQALRAYNASIIASAPLVAVSANSPYLFGKDLWAETRIPVFEQAVEVGGFEEDGHGPMRRVSFGSGYARQSIMECFVENLEHFPVLLPTLFDVPPEKLQHLRLHNGTLWRWNRPLIGFNRGDNNGNKGKPHLRIEQRVVPSGPTIEDAVANAAIYYGLTQALCDLEQAPEKNLTFPQARDNFYACAQHGLDAHCLWLDGQKHPVRSLLLKVILPLAHTGLETLGIDKNDIDHYLRIIEQRVISARNGAAWQRAYVAKHGPDMKALLATYLQHQHTGIPVHEWDV